jgi:glycosyltransferase involved in cell wall biosynthesis
MVCSGLPSGAFLKLKNGGCSTLAGKNDKIDFSVIIPLYNKAFHIPKAIHSVLNQTCQDFELIVVNDGSTDDSLKIVRQIIQLSDKPINIHDQSNTGVSTARNNGARLATNDYIAFLDADDWWHPSYLSEMKQLIERHPEAGIYAAKYAQVKHGKKKDAVIGVPDGFSSGYINYFAVYAKTMWMPLFPSSAIMPRRLFLDYKGFKPEIKLGEDFELWVRLALNYPVAFLNKVLVFYNQDVDVSDRGVSPERFHPPERHFVYHLEQFKEDEKKNPDLKILLDRLKAEALLKYHLHGINPEETQKILQHIDFNHIPSSIKRQYAYPKTLVRMYWHIKKKLSAAKQLLLRQMAGTKS